MSFLVDHIVILVEDLAAAIEDYRAGGFAVAPGGEHTDGATHNALIAFADGSYFELIAFKRSAPEHRWWQHVAHGEGLIDWALLPSDIDADITTAAERGVAYRGPFPGGRQRPDGQELRWQTGVPPSADLPFLCADVTPRSLRVPEGEARIHPNGATGIAKVTIGVANHAASTIRYAALLGSAPEETTGNFLLGQTVIELTQADTEGPYALSLQGIGQPLDRDLCHGVRFGFATAL